MNSVEKYFLRRRINKILKNSKREKKFLNWKEIKRILLLFDTKDHTDAQLFMKRLKRMSKKVKVCAYKNKNDKNEYSEILYEVVTEKDFNFWKNDSLKKTVDSLNSESYDLAINLTLQDNLFLQYLLVSVDATFRVGFCKTNLPIYDMVLSFSSEMETNKIITIRDLSKQMIYYLETISSGNIKIKK